MLAQTQKGVALITALIFTVLVTSFAVAIASQQQIDIRRTGNILAVERAYLLSQGIEDWAGDILKRDITDATGDIYDHLGEEWATELPPIEIEGAVISGKITDLQGLININGLVDTSGAPVTTEIERFQRLLELFSYDTDLVDAVVDWIDPDTETRVPAGAEDSTYLSKEPAYRTSNEQMISISELRLVEGFTNEIYTTLSPFLTALPSSTITGAVPVASDEEDTDPGDPAPAGEGMANGTPINLNTAPLEVIQALLGDSTSGPLSESEAQSFLDNIESEEGYETVTALNDDSIIAGLDKSPSDFGTFGPEVRSEYFLIEAQAVLPDAQIQLFSVVQRDNDGNLSVLMRGQGSY